MNAPGQASLALILALAIPVPAGASPFFFSTGDPDGRMASASRPDTSGLFEIESADDFLLAQSTRLTGATFTGLVPTGASVGDVVVEIYRVFPEDSDSGRTPNVPTRVNSPSDVAFNSRDSATGNMTFSESVLAASFTAANSVQPGGIHPKPGQTTGGDGSVTGEEVEFSVNFATPITLPVGHYFFVPQVGLTGGDFFWLSAPKPIVAGTPFTPDLQSWTRDEFLDPDWLRIGTDIVGAGAFNASFSLTGIGIPEPSVLSFGSLGLAGLLMLRWRKSSAMSVPIGAEQSSLTRRGAGS